ncbi:type VII secretion protein EssC [Alloiococcus sp. CFN-8]|uniref:type VII secretion protein EssC n=1 Tax=Alloiococcus sp. CFN-8 TaxID=3416081 RepID=UPI003CF1B5DC
MESRYKIIISNKNLYKEIELTSDMKEVKVGTAVECDIRLRKELFFGPIELVFVKNGDGWSVLCSDNLYLNLGDVRKLMTKALSHGDSFEVKYQDSNNEVFNIDFLIDFDNGKRRYDRVIDISSSSIITIGAAASNNIVIKSPFVQKDAIVLEHKYDVALDYKDAIALDNKDGKLKLTIKATTYGVYHNGNKASNNVVIDSGDFFSISDFFFYYKEGRLWTEAREGITIKELSYEDLKTKESYPKFNRSTRVKTVISDERIEILDPPAKPQKPKNNLFTRLLSSMGMLIAAGFMWSRGGTTMIVFSGITGGMAILTTIISVRDNNKEFKKQSAERINKYQAYIGKKRKEIEEQRVLEHKDLEKIYVSLDMEKERVLDFSEDLFDRMRDHEDFLSLYLGTGAVEAKREINYKKQERLEVEDELQQIPEMMWNEYKYIHNAPVVCDLKSVNAVAVVGEEKFRFEMLKNMVIDIAARQYHSDVKMVFVADSGHKEDIYWLRMLPQVYSDEIGGRTLVWNDDSKNLVFEYLYKELTEREQNKTFDHNIVIFFYKEYGFKSHPISRFIDKGKDLGVTFIFFGEEKADIPFGCGYIISLLDKERGILTNVEDQREDKEFTYKTISHEKACEIIRILAPVYTEEISLESTLTKNISLFELLNIIAVDDIDLKNKWGTSQVFNSMSAPIGVSKAGVVSLDLHDKAHGPHGLVAGTTGAGKSEILQTYILSMATLYHPYEAAFVIIDFKGGGMVNQFRELPHLLGAITNIDGKAINRSLKSIKAELQKRQRLFAEADVNHIDRYIRKYKTGEAAVPLPHLIIIVDEFAELKAEQPEFMKELISAARIGRSLGVHLILATQKPSGQVNEQIWSNSRFKLCLKVQSKEDSNEVLKSPLAAEIKEPGRAYLQVGNNEIFELFQSAYSGASEKVDEVNVKEFTIYSYNEAGKKVPVYVQKKKKNSEDNTTQLDAIVRYVMEFCEANRLSKLPDICLPALSEVIDYPEMVRDRSAGGIQVQLGVYDDPENQYQGIYSVDVESNNVMIIGSSQSGKTNLLQTIIRSIASRYSPEEASIYILDFASMVLKNFESLSNVGGVVCPSEDEKLKNLFKLLYSEVESRKEKLIAVGVSSYSAYKEAGNTDIPLMVLIIDNLTALKEMYFKDDDDELLHLCREGLSVGISIVIANSHTAGIGYKYLSNFATRIAMYSNDSNEYSSLFDHCSERIDNIPGRAIIKLENRHLECQAYLAFKGEKEIHRVKEIKEYIAVINGKHKNVTARNIPVIPASLTDAYVSEQFANQMQNKYKLVMGLDYGSVAPLSVDFASLGVLAIAGRENTGKHNWLKYSIGMLDSQYPSGSKVYIVDGINKKLSSLKKKENVEAYSIISEDAVTIIKNIEAQLKDRYDALLAGNEEILSTSELLMVVINNQDSLVAISNNIDALTAYKNILGRYKNLNVCIIVAGVENANIPYSAPELLKNIRDGRHLLYFDDMSNMKLFDLPLAMIRSFKKPIELGDCYYIKENSCTKLKTPLCIREGRTS